MSEALLLHRKDTYEKEFYTLGNSNLNILRHYSFSEEISISKNTLDLVS